MKIGVLRYPGGHGDTELKYVLEHFFNLDVGMIWYKKGVEFDCDLLFIGGGFPCKTVENGEFCINDEEFVRTLKLYSGSGKRLVGFGNGFQLLCELGLLPGRMKKNESERFICRHMYIKFEGLRTDFNNAILDDEVFRVPVSTYYGRYEAEEKDLIMMRQEGQIIFRFCDHHGLISESVNCTGSLDNIAGVCNHERNVFGLIPQPERAVIDSAGEADGKKIIEGFFAL